MFRAACLLTLAVAAPAARASFVPVLSSYSTDASASAANGIDDQFNSASDSSAFNGAVSLASLAAADVVGSSGRSAASAGQTISLTSIRLAGTSSSEAAGAVPGDALGYAYCSGQFDFQVTETTLVYFALSASADFAGDAEHSGYGFAYLLGPADTFSAFAEVSAGGAATDSFGGLVTLAPGSYTAGFQTFSYTSATGGTGGRGGASVSLRLEAVAVSEPPSFALAGIAAGLGLGGCALRRRRVNG